MPFTIGAPKADIPDGTYTGSLLRVEEVPSPGGKWGSESYRIWHFLLDVNGVATELDENTSTNNGPKTRSYAFLAALLNRELKAGEEVDDPIGAKALIKVIHNENGYPKIESLAPFAEPASMFPGVPR